MDYWLLGIAVWRVTRMIWTEAGPLDIFMRMRAAFARHQKRSGGLFDLVSCFYCISVWVALLPSLFIAHNILTLIADTFILSGIASLIQEFLNKINIKGNHASK